MAIDLNALSPKELDALISAAKQRKTALKKRQPIAAIRKRIIDFATAEGYLIAELFGGKSVSTKTTRATKAKKATANKSRKAGSNK